MRRDYRSGRARETPASVLTSRQPPLRGEAVARLGLLTVRLAQGYLWTTAIALILFASLLGAVSEPQAAPGRVSLVCAAAGVVCALAALWAARALRAALVLGPVAAILASGVTALNVDWAAPAPDLGFVAMHAGLAMALGGLRAGVPVTAASVLLVAVLALGQIKGWIGAPQGGLNLAVVVAMQLLLIGVAATIGRITALMVRRFTRSADEREHRFSSLLRLSADAYWEIDTGMRLRHLRLERSGEPTHSGAAALGAIPWELPHFVCHADVLDQLQADLGARQPLHDVSVAWRGRQGLRHFLISGEPRTDADGVFLGYWGVARDVTATWRAEHALLRTEARYHDLFVSIPNPLVLHRDGRVIDANPAAMAMFGFEDLSEMLGSSLFEVYEAGDSREREQQRTQRLHTMPPGEALPVASFTLQSHSGKTLQVRCTAVAVETDRGAAALSIYVDDTERQAAEDVLRRSEALLSHLVASSPDVITLTEVDSGRYVMANRSFERITGWPVDEVIGRTSMEIGVWFDAQDRQRFVSQVQALGRVQDMPVRFSRRDGAPVPMLVSGARFHADRRDYLVINARDMTDVEQHRLETEAILENASLGIALTRSETFQLVNPAFEAMLGWPPGSLVGQPGSCVWPSLEAYREIGQKVGPLLARGEQAEVECEARRRDGSAILCRLLARAVDPSHPSRGGTIWVVEDITEKRRMDEALARARDAAEAASRAKSAFLANTSHELRTPLNGLLGFAQLARTPGLDEQRRSGYLEQILESARSLSEIVSDILDLSKIEAGRLTLESTTFDLGKLLSALQRSYATLAAGRGLTLTLEAPADLGLVRGDALRVRQILTNYLSNAIKFTEHGEVRLRARRLDAQRVRFQVVDTGPGIDAATQTLLFKPFTQADQSTTRRFGGTGLGLSICRELAGLMGGEVGVHSRPGAGSRFWAELTLPAATPSPTDTTDTTETTQADLADTAGAHVLLVDDNAVNLMVAAAQLEQAGVRVGQAADGRQALDAVAAAEAAGDPFELVLMDLQMPDLSGYEVTAALRRRPASQALPIVAHSAAALVSERAAALAAGMNDFLPKPTDVTQLRAMVARWAGPRRR